MSESRIGKLLEAAIVAGSMSAAGTSGLEASASVPEKKTTSTMELENSKYEQIVYPDKPKKILRK